MKNKYFYLRFAAIANALNRDTGINLDGVAQRLLEVIAEAYMAGNPLKVTDALLLENIASASTLHKKIDFLKAQGFVQVEHPADSRRTKSLAPTDMALKHFDQLGRAIIKTYRLAEKH